MQSQSHTTAEAIPTAKVLQLLSEADNDKKLEFLQWLEAFAVLAKTNGSVPASMRQN